jgi:exopolysaccharide production protein ExoQ
LATASRVRSFTPFTFAPGRGSRPASAEDCAPLWGRVSTWALLLLLLYFAVDGVSPFSNSPVATRAVATDSAGGTMMERLSKLLVFGVCMLFAAERWPAVRRMCKQTKLITSFPLFALLLCPVSQMPSRTISSATLLLSAILLLYALLSKYSFDQMLELFLVLGFIAIAASAFLALALPQYGRDLMGGHSTAWKGIFSAKNYLGHMGLFFLTVAMSYRGRTSLLRLVRGFQVVLCLVAIGFSQAATSYILTAFYCAYFVIVTVLHRLRKKDYVILVLVAFFCLLGTVAVIAASPDFLFSLLGKDSTLTGRTGIWVATLESIARRPLFGYGYQAFWLGLEGESYHVILAVSWLLAQAQNGYIDVALQMGAVGLSIVLLVFAFAFRDAATCLFRSRSDAQLHAVEWYLAIVLLTFLWNLDESFLFEPKHLGSMMFLIACIGLKKEWMALRAAAANTRPNALGNSPRRWMAPARQASAALRRLATARFRVRFVP